MAQTVLKIELPDSAFRSLKIPRDQWPKFLLRTVAVALYREGKISLGKAIYELYPIQPLSLHLLESGAFNCYENYSVRSTYLWQYTMK